jgi:ATP-dependent RNA helicase RhlE
VSLDEVEILVLDEADRMVDMGFAPDLRRILRLLPRERQSLMFSATMPAEIRDLAGTMLKSPAKVQVAPVSATADRIEQCVYFVEKRNKSALLAHLFHRLPIARGVVFTRTKHGADKVVRHLHARGITAEAIHGNKAQNARERALSNFRTGRTPLLIATDIASRGIDVDGITHVINYDLTHEPEVYVHRIGRTARAGASGASVSFCDNEEMPNLRAIEKLIRQPIPVREDHPDYPSMAQVAPPQARPQHPVQQHGASRHAARSAQGGRPHSSGARPAGGHAQGPGRGALNRGGRGRPAFAHTGRGRSRGR